MLNIIKEEMQQLFWKEGSTEVPSEGSVYYYKGEEEKEQE